MLTTESGYAASQKGRRLIQAGLLTTVAAALSMITSDIAAAAPGDLDPTFGSGGKVTTAIGSYNDEARAVAIQSDGKIVAAGYSSTDSKTDFAVVRYNSDGSLDTTFDSDGMVTTPIGSSDDGALSVAIQLDGKIVTAGYSISGGYQDFAVVRYNTDGTLDTTFDADGKVTTAVGSSADLARGVAIQSDGKIVVVGQSFSTDYDFALVRYNTDGSLDTTFDADGILTTPIGSVGSQAYAVAIQTDGKIVAAGSTGNASDDFAVVRYNTDGSLDTTFDADGKVTTPIGGSFDEAYALAIQSDDKIVVAGTSSSDFAAVRYNTDGSLDTTFDGDGKVTTAIGSSFDHAYSVAIQLDGKIVLAGYSYDGNEYDFAVLRYHDDGSLDAEFDVDGKLTTDVGGFSDFASAIAIQPDGKIVVAGHAEDVTSRDIAVVRYEGTPTPCGNGTVDGPSEDCDGSVCCSAFCLYQPTGTPCPDVDLCNGHETCDGAGTCEPGTPLDCHDGDLCTQDSCDPIDGCENVAEPASTCFDTWSKGSLFVRESVAGKEKLVAKFLKGPALAQADLGNPLDLDGTTYTTCIYNDQGTLVESLEVDRAGLACAGKACWRELGTRGYSYKDRDASSDGIQQIRLVAGDQGKSKILIKAGNSSKKSQLDLPLGIAAALSNSTSATVQLFRDDAPACFSMTLSNIKKQEGDIFTATK